MWEEIFKKNKKISNCLIEEYLESINFKVPIRIVHIVGTNGKGSVSNYLSQGLMAANYKVGLFTSPHILYANERIKVNEKMISDSDFFRIRNELDISELHFFAQTYIVALKYFVEQGCDIAIIEAGIGGKEDVTKIFEGELALLTSVSFDHTELLGDSLIKIAYQKRNICTNCKFYFPSTIDKNAKEFLTYSDSNEIQIDEKDNYQIQNKEFASKILRTHFKIEFTNFTTPTGRSEIRKWNDINIGLDVAHNEEGMKKSLSFYNKNKIDFPVVLLMMKKSKSISAIPVLLKNKNVYYYQMDETFHDFEIFGYKKVESLKEFLKKQKENTLCIGSFYLIGGVLETID